MINIDQNISSKVQTTKTRSLIQDLQEAEFINSKFNKSMSFSNKINEPKKDII